MIVILMLVAYSFSVPSDLSDAPNIYILRLLFLAVALYLFATVAPFIGRGELNGYWHYNKALVLRLMTAFLYSVVLYVGLAIALAALDNLFGIEIPAKRYGELGVFIYGIFTTWYFLAGIPDDLDGLNKATDFPKGLKIFTQYILFPIASVYLIILYAYLTKIIIVWDWPKGWVSELILGFSATGMLSILLLYPIREYAENRWIRVASKWFYVVMIPLIVMLFPAIIRRTSEYGITEGRYVVIALSIWLTAMVFYFITSKTRNIKILPASLCILLLLSSFGPWGAFSVSENSQTGRLKQLLEKNSILVDGSIQKAKAPIPFEDAKQISSIITYLHDIHGYDRIQPWYEENLKQDSAGDRLAYKDPPLVTKIMGIEYVKTWFGVTGNEVILNADPEGVMDVEGYSWMIRTDYISGGQLDKNFINQDISYRISAGLDTIEFTHKSEGNITDSLQIDLYKIMVKLVKDYGNINASHIPPEKMSVSDANQRMKVKVYLKHFRIRRQGGDVKPIAYRAEILYSIIGKPHDFTARHAPLCNNNSQKNP